MKLNSSERYCILLENNENILSDVSAMLIAINKYLIAKVSKNLSFTNDVCKILKITHQLEKIKK